MLSIAIVEDNPNDAESIKNCLSYVKEQEGIDYCVSEFSNAMKFLFHSSFDYDLIILDIQMPMLDGIEAAKKIRQQNKTVGIIFVTNMRQLAIKGYEVGALDFILKPLNKYDFYLKMQHILARLSKNRTEQILIGSGDDMIAIPVGMLVYLEVTGHYVTYHMREGSVSEYSTLKAVEEKLSAYHFFIRCNRYCLVNLNCVDKISGDEVVLGKVHLAISRARKNELYKAFAEFYGGIKSYDS